MWRKIVAAAVNNPEKTVKSALSWRRVLNISDSPVIRFSGNKIATNVPLSSHNRMVAAKPEDLGDCHCIIAEKSLIRWHSEIWGHMTYPSLMRI